MLRNRAYRIMLVDLRGTCVTYDAGNEGRYYCMFAECLSRDLYRIVHRCRVLNTKMMSRFMMCVIE